MMSAKRSVCFGLGSTVRHLLVAGSGENHRFQFEESGDEARFDRMSFLIDRPGLVQHVVDETYKPIKKRVNFHASTVIVTSIMARNI